MIKFPRSNALASLYILSTSREHPNQPSGVPRLNRFKNFGETILHAFCQWPLKFEREIGCILHFNPQWSHDVLRDYAVSRVEENRKKRNQTDSFTNTCFTLEDDRRSVKLLFDFPETIVVSFKPLNASICECSECNGKEIPK